MVRLPVSGLPVVFRQPTGFEDLLLRETNASPTELALALIGRLVRSSGDSSVEWAGLTMTDIEALLLLLRQSVLGDVIRAETRCSGESCGASVDVSFGISAYLRSHKIRTPGALEKADSAGWFRLRGQEVQFRLPNGGDLAAIEGQPNAEQQVMQRCLRPADAPERVRHRVERAMEAMAPLLSQMLSGECPECHGNMAIFFDVRSFVLHELRNLAASIYQDVHLLALHYKWPEEQILALPRSRRLRYVELIRDQGAAA